MMGPRQVAQGALFYEFSIEDHVTPDHLLRAMDRFVDLGDMRGVDRRTQTLMQVSASPEMSDYQMVEDIAVLVADIASIGEFAMSHSLYSTALHTVILILAGIVLQGCETTEGFGKDVSSAGQAVSDAAQENKGY